MLILSSYVVSSFTWLFISSPCVHLDYSACGLLQRRKDQKKVKPTAPAAELGTRKKRSLRMRIIGGETVTRYWPWMAGLFYGTPKTGVCWHCCSHFSGECIRYMLCKAHGLLFFSPYLRPPHATDTAMLYYMGWT